jgi:hypothetical protein
MAARVGDFAKVFVVWNAMLAFIVLGLVKSLRNGATWPIAVYDRYSSPIGFWTGFSFSVFVLIFLLVGDLLMVASIFFKL